MKKFTTKWVFSLVVVLSMGIAHRGQAAELESLSQNPELKARLIKWEQEAPKDIKIEIDILRTRNSIEKAYAAGRLGDKGVRAKGAILALMETFRDRTALQWGSSYSPGGPPTSPAGEAAKAIGKIGKVTVEPLIQALKDRDYYVRKVAAETLGQIGDERAVEPLIQALKDQDESVRKVAAETLGQIGDERAVEPLIQALKDQNRDAHGAVTEALGKIGDKRAVEPLILALKDRFSLYSVVRIADAAKALGQIGDNRAVEPLIQALKNQDYRDFFVRQAAAEALGKIGDNRAVEPLIQALKDQASDVRQAAAEALGKIGDNRAVEPLIQALKDQDSDVRQAAAWALKKMRAKKFGQDYDQWMAWWQSQTK